MLFSDTFPLIGNRNERLGLAVTKIYLFGNHCQIIQVLQFIVVIISFTYNYSQIFSCLKSEFRICYLDLI